MHENGVWTPFAHFFDSFCLLNHFHQQIGICHSRSDTNQKIVREGLKCRILALSSLSVTYADHPRIWGPGILKTFFRIIFFS